jgi:aerobic carbon-monoxide dehydrogenase medium subunit
MVAVAVAGGMKPAPFTYHHPGRLDEALELLRQLGSEAQPLAGGQSLVPMMNMRVARPEHLVDLNDLDELAVVREETAGVMVGALVRHRVAAQSTLLQRLCPILPEVAATIGHVAIRERGTVGGSLALADPAAQWPLLALLLDARIDLASIGGRRSLSARDFFLAVFTTAIRPDELVFGVVFPTFAAGEGWGYRAFCRRHGDFAIVAVAATLLLDGEGRVARLRLSLAGVDDTPVVLDALAAAQRGRLPDAAWRREVAAAAAGAITPTNNPQASAAFRRELAAVLSEAALGDALTRSGRSR